MTQMRPNSDSTLRRTVMAVVVATLAVAGCSPGTGDGAAAPSTATSTTGSKATSTTSTTTTVDGTSTSTSTSASEREASTTTAGEVDEPTDSTRPPAAGDGGPHAVVRVADDDLLNVREEPDPKADKFGGLTPFYMGINLTGEDADVGDQRWVKVDGGTGDFDGWANGGFLVPIQGDADQTFWFYRDASAYRELLSASPNAQRLGEQIEASEPGGELVVSADGYFDDDDPVLSVGDLAGAGTSSDTERTWGSDPGTGEPITATIEGFFADLAGEPSLTTTEAVAVDERIQYGNTLDNAQEFFPDGVVVELHYGGDEADSYLSWRTTRVVLKKVSEADEAGPGPPGMTPEQDWRLVGLAFDGWTP